MAFKDYFREFQNIKVSNEVLLRQVIPEQDAKDFYDIYIDEEAYQYFAGYKKPGKYDDNYQKILISRIRNFASGHDYSWTVVYNNKVIGQIQLFNFQNSKTYA